jgi:hypothetical protein
VKEGVHDRPPPSGVQQKEGKLSLRDRWFGSKKERGKTVEKEKKKLRKEKRRCAIM